MDSPEEAHALHPASAVEERPPPAVRWFVLILLSAFALCGAMGIEAWPLTGWRLFSHLRTSHVETWRAVTVDGRGRESPLAFSRLPPPYVGSGLIVRRLSSLSERQRAGLCAAWLSAAVRLRREVAAVRIYRLEWELEPRHAGRPARSAVRALEYACLPEPLQEVAGGAG